MTDTSKTDNISIPNDISNTQGPPTPFDTEGINNTSAADSLRENNSTINTFEQPVAGGDVNIPLSSSATSVVVPNSTGKAPKWFYIIFILTLIIFIAVTVLLVMSVMQKSNNTIKDVPAVSPVVTKVVTKSVVVSPSTIPSPTIEATDAGTLKISQVSSSDEIKDIENDIKTTDFSPIESGLSTLDGELDFKTSL